MNQSPSNLPPDVDYQPPQPSEGLSTGAKWGIGCGSGCLVALLIAGIVGYLAWSKTKEAIGDALDKFTSPDPIVFVAPEAEESVITAVMARFDAFTQAMKDAEEAEPLILTGEEINLLIYHHPDWNELAGKTSVDIVGDQFTGEVSLPLGELMPLLAGRYLNGQATVRIGLENGYLTGFIDALKVAEEEAPADVIRELQTQNIFQDAQQDPELRKLIETLEEIRVEDGKLIVIPKPAAERGGAAPAETPAEASAPAAVQ